jgi:hypothetical protein
VSGARPYLDAADGRDPLVERVHEAARLRGLAYFNDYDANDFPRCGIRYYVDPAVALLLFIWPGRLLDEERHNQNYLATVSEEVAAKKVVDAVLSGERLFSRDAAEDVEDRDTGPFMMPEHWAEFARQLKQFFAGPANPQEFLERFDKAAFERDLAAAEGFMEEGARIDQDALDDHARELCEAVAAIEHTRFMEVAMVSRLRQRKLLRPQINLPQDIYRIDARVVNAWTRLLKESGKKGAIRTDAIVLAQLDALNGREYEKAKRGERYVMHCLVTGDLHLHEAFFRQRYDWAKKEPVGYVGEYDDELDRFVPDLDGNRYSRFMRHYTIRHPAQFVAMLNQKALPNSISTMSLFRKVVENTEYLLTSVTQTESRSLQLAFDAVRGDMNVRRAISDLLQKVSISDKGQISEDLVSTLDEWRSLTGSTFLVNRATLRDRVRATRQAFEHLERDPKAYIDGLVKLQNDLIEELDQTVLVFTARKMLAEMSETARHLEDRRGIARRMHARLLIDLSDITGETLMLDVLRAYDTEDKATIDRIERNLERLPPQQSWRTFLFCAILAARISGWERLVWVGGRALNAIRDHEEHVEEAFEARYVVALGRRMRLKPGDYEAARELLRTAAEHHRGAMLAATHEETRTLEAVRAARALSEHATLCLFEQSRRLMLKADADVQDADPLDQATMLAAPEMFREAIDLVSEAVDHPGETRDAERLRRVARFVLRQATLNLPLFALFGHVIFENDPEFVDTFETEDFIAQVERAQRVWAIARDNTDRFDQARSDAAVPKLAIDADEEIRRDYSEIIQIDFEILLISVEGERGHEDALAKLKRHTANMRDLRDRLEKAAQGSDHAQAGRLAAFELDLTQRMMTAIVEYYEMRATQKNGLGHE